MEKFCTRTALGKPAVTNFDTFDFDNLVILAVERNKTKGKILEIIHIVQIKKSVNLRTWTHPFVIIADINGPDVVFLMFLNI